MVFPVVAGRRSGPVGARLCYVSGLGSRDLVCAGQEDSVVRLVPDPSTPYDVVPHPPPPRNLHSQDLPVHRTLHLTLPSNIIVHRRLPVYMTSSVTFDQSVTPPVTHPVSSDSVPVG